MIYQDMVAFAHSWGLVFFVILFVIAVVYALWPGHKEKFAEAARRPLDEE